MDNTAKTSSCLAISEKKTHRPGGCIGIFFQLFDWNRRLAKKKLFSKKLLTPARTKQASKNFTGGEKMPASKIHLIADENRGGFPNVNKNGNRGSGLEHKSEMRVPGLVARLMGLESMPVVNRDKPRKTSSSDSYDNVGKNFVEDLNLEKPSAKVETRPLKLQKTGPSERKVISRIGADVLQYKSVLSRSRKHHPPKFVSSVKSPRNPSGRNVSRASRLIDVASRILEPGLQASNRVKSALTHPNAVRYSPNEALSREIGTVPMEAYDSSKSIGHASCKNCNNLLKVEVFNHNDVEQPNAVPNLNSNYTNASSQGSGRSKITAPVPPVLPPQLERDEVLETNCDQPKIFAYKHNEPKECIMSHGISVTERMPLIHESPYPSTRRSGQPFKLRKSESSVVFKQQNQSEDQLSSSLRDRMLSRSKSSNLQSRRITSSANAVSGSKNFVALNRSLNGCSKVKLPTQVENSKFGTERTSFNGREDYSSPSRTSPRKRRTANISGQIVSKDSVDSSAVKEQVSKCDTLSRTSSRLERKVISSNQSCAKSKLSRQREGEKAYTRDKDIVSFTFNSPARQKTRVTSKMDESMANERNLCSQKTSLSGGDAVAILEQKLKELASRDNDELVSASPLKRSTAIILQELITALASEDQVPFKGSTVDMDVTFCDDANKESLIRMCNASDHYSPGSVLEASFSSSSVDDSSGCRMPADSIDYSTDQLRLSGPDTDLLDSANSLSKGSVGNEMVTELFTAMSRILQSLSYNHTGITLTGNKLYHAKEVMFKTEVLFGNVTPNRMNENNLLILPLFIDELETFTCEMWTNFSDFNSLEDSKDVNHLKGFLFDCLIECLDSKYIQVCKSGFNSSVLNARTILQDVEKEIRKWTCFVGMMTDEIVEWEMSHSLGKWTDFSVEAFESGADIDGDILQTLVEEIVTDLWESRGSY